MRPLPSQLSHFSLVLGSTPVPEQTVHAWNLGAHRRTVSMIRLVIGLPPKVFRESGPWTAVLWSSASLAAGMVAGHDSKETIP